MTQGAPQSRSAATNGFAIASFVTALLGIVVLGLVFGYIALAQIKQNKQEGRGFALAGIIISYVYLGMCVLAMIFVMIFFGLFASLFAKPLVTELPNIINSIDAIEETPSPSELRSLANEQSEAIESGDKSLRIIEVIPYSPTNKIYAPAEGMRFLAVKVEERNQADESVRYEPAWYGLFTYDTGFSQQVTDIKPELRGGTLDPGERIAGYIVFEIPKSVTTEDLFLNYDPIPSSGAYEAVWRLE
ncbi:MAG: DUF4190 domain-containing protein [Parcubacteria group bacterium]